jgi:hypothetical protein
LQSSARFATVKLRTLADLHGDDGVEHRLPTGEVRELRALLSRRAAVVAERTRWLLRARSYLQATGYAPPRAHRSMPRLLPRHHSAAGHDPKTVGTLSR